MAKATIQFGQVVDGKKQVTDHTCKQPTALAWEQVRGHLQDIATCVGDQTPNEKWLSRECQAGVDVVSRLLKCQESDGKAFDSVRTTYWKLSTARHLGELDGCEEKLGDLEASLENLCRLAPELDGKRNTSACHELGTLENLQSTYRR